MKRDQPRAVDRPESPGRLPPKPVEGDAIDPVAVDPSAVRTGLDAGGGLAGLPWQHPTAGSARVAAVVALQRTHGNAAAQRMLARNGVAVRERTLQRHTSVALEEEENAIRRAVIQRDLASDLSDEASKSFFADKDVIFAAIDRASADGKRAVLNNLPLLADLRKALDRGDLVTALNKLGAPLADQLDAAMTAGKASAATIELQSVGLEPMTALLADPAQPMMRLRARVDLEGQMALPNGASLPMAMGEAELPLDRVSAMVQDGTLPSGIVEVPPGAGYRFALPPLTVPSAAVTCEPLSPAPLSSIATPPTP